MSQQGSSSDEYEKAILWVPDPTSPAGWIRRKVWPQEDTTRPRNKRAIGFGNVPRERED
jgi:hypothetical protein